jgi:hypothetical protein
MADSTNFKKTNLGSWVEWKKECALAKCATAAQSDVQDWASPSLRRVDRDLGAEWEEIENRQKRISNGVCAAWYEFEMYLKFPELDETSEVKAAKVRRKKIHIRKDVICDRAEEHAGADSQRNSYEALISTEINQAYRTRKIRKQQEQESKEIPLSRFRNDEGPLDITVIKLNSPEWEAIYGEDTEPAADADKTLEKIRAVAIQEAKAALSRFTELERITLVCKSLGIGLQKPELLSAGNCNKHDTYEAFNSGASKFEAVFKEMQIKHGQDSEPESWIAFRKEFTCSFRDFCEETVPPEILRLARS